MRKIRWQAGAVFAIALFLGWTVGVRADEKHEAKKTPPKYKAHIHHEAKEFDLSKPDHHDELMKHIKAGSVEELELVAPPPQPLDIWWDVGLWTIVVFIALLFILRKMAWGPMLEGLQKREQSIRSAVEEAKIARDETRRVTAQFQAEMAAKMAEIPKIMEEARRDAEQLKEEMRNEATKAIQLDRQRLLRDIETARDQALQEILNRTAQLATLISAKAIGRHLSEEDHRRLIDESLAEMTSRQRV
jgi:F-type H+-transporting ATPase subunit b